MLPKASIGAFDGHTASLGNTYDSRSANIPNIAENFRKEYDMTLSSPQSVAFGKIPAGQSEGCYCVSRCGVGRPEASRPDSSGLAANSDNTAWERDRDLCSFSSRGYEAGHVNVFKSKVRGGQMSLKNT